MEVKRDIFHSHYAALSIYKSSILEPILLERSNVIVTLVPARFATFNDLATHSQKTKLTIFSL